METAIKLEHIYKTYNGVPVVKDLSIQIAQGSFVCVIGGSGSGKTTLLKMINRLVIPDTGQIWVNGQDISLSNVVQLRRGIGYAVQGSALFPHLTVAQNIAYVPNLIKRGHPLGKEQALKEWMHVLDLPEEILTRYPAQLSGGQQQRVGIARALAAKPKILLMDEAFGAVDALTRAKLQEVIQELHKQMETTIVLVTHDVPEAVKLATHILVMHQGQLQQYAPPHEVLAKPATERVAELLLSGLAQGTTAQP